MYRKRSWYCIKVNEFGLPTVYIKQRWPAGSFTCSSGLGEKLRLAIAKNRLFCILWAIIIYFSGSVLSFFHVWILSHLVKAPLFWSRDRDGQAPIPQG
jgi:hypothetical protein